jgi:hypothetical protein
MKSFTIALVFLLVACSPDPEPSAAIVGSVQEATVTDDTVASPPPASPSLVPAAGLAVPDVTVNALMKDTIDPAARDLWAAVSYVVSAEGTQETSPETDEDWTRLRNRADALMQASMTLQLPGLRMHVDANAQRPDFQFMPREIEAAVADNPFPWRGYAQDMQMTTLQILGAIERRDLMEYSSLGVTLNDACDGCHGEYWYKPQPMRGAEGIR